MDNWSPGMSSLMRTRVNAMSFSPQKTARVVGIDATPQSYFQSRSNAIGSFRAMATGSFCAARSSYAFTSAGIRRSKALR